MSGSKSLKFDQLGLNDKLLKAVTEAGYSEPTPIQAEAIPNILGGKDITGIAQTGTGKTAAFVLPLIDKLSSGRARARMPRSLILEPTRELADQVAENFVKYGVHHKLSMALLIGGVSMGDQIKALEKGVDVLIATPGRLLDLFDRGKILLTGVDIFVIDEADRMLDMGFIPDIERICTLIPPRRQTLLFSATMPPEIAKLAERFQKFPERIEVARPATTASTITQYKVMLSESSPTHRRAALRGVIKSCEVNNAIIFCNRKREVDIVAKSLAKHGFEAAPIHGDLDQSYRMETLKKFRDGDLKFLVASDVAARGLDIPDVSHVFNFAPPPHSDDYVHRIGRTGRAGRKGEAITLVAPADDKIWKAVLERTGNDPHDFKSEALKDELETLGARAPRNKRRDEKNDRSPHKPRDKRSAEKQQERREGRFKQDEVLPPAKENVKGMGEHVPAFFKID